MRTAVTGTRVASVAFIVPFMAVYRPGLLLLGPVGEIAGAILVAIAAVFVLSIALEGHFVRPLGVVTRALLGAAGIALAVPLTVMDAVGAVVAVAVCAREVWAVRNRPGPASVTGPASRSSLSP